MSGQKERVRVAIGDGLFPVGDLMFETDGRRQSSAFQYSEEWLSRPGAFALSPSLPLSEFPTYHSGNRENRRGALPGVISDATPDSWGRGIITKALGGHPPSELEFLLTVNDQTRQGALRFLDQDGKPMSQDEPPTPRLNDLMKISGLVRRIEAGQADIEEFRKLVGPGGSLGGARPKSDYLDDDGVLCVAKFTSERDTMAIERMEVATLNLANSVGLRAANARLALKNTQLPVAIIQRFDRLGDKRRHFLSAQSFLDVEHASGGFYTDMVDAMREHCGGGEQLRGELHELHRRIAFTILASNNDNHLKNEAFLYADNDSWVLSPAFDINPQPERHRILESGISPLSGNEASIVAAIEAAPFFDLNEDAARASIATMAQQIHDEWKSHCKDQGMSGAEINSYARAFSNPEMEIALKLGNHAVPGAGSAPSM